MGRPFVALLGVLAAGCVSARVQSTRPGLPGPARPPESIEVLEQAPEAPYTVIARVECRTGAVYHDEDDLRRKLVEEAAASRRRCADPRGRVDRTPSPSSSRPAMIMTEEKRLPAEVIVFDRPEETGPGVGPSGGF